MPCKKFRNQFFRFAFDHDTAVEKSFFKHLKGCPRCQSDYDTDRSVNRLMDGLAEKNKSFFDEHVPFPSVQFNMNLLSRLESEAGRAHTVEESWVYYEEQSGPFVRRVRSFSRRVIGIPGAEADPALAEEATPLWKKSWVPAAAAACLAAAVIVVSDPFEQTNTARIAGSFDGVMQSESLADDTLTQPAKSVAASLASPGMPALQSEAPAASAVSTEAQAKKTVVASAAQTGEETEATAEAESEEDGPFFNQGNIFENPVVTGIDAAENPPADLQYDHFEMFFHPVSEKTTAK